ncbi:MAG: AAA family ATPase [bacterium]
MACGTGTDGSTVVLRAVAPRRSPTRGADANPPGRLITPLIPPEDFARQLSFEELANEASATASVSRVLVCSAVAEGPDGARLELGDTRVRAVLRELTLFMRRNLRSADAVATVDSELVLLLEDGTLPVNALAQRLLAAVRTHVFAGMGGESPNKLTLSMGIAMAPDHGTSFPALLAAARVARAAAGSDSFANAYSGRPNVLELSRFVGRAEPLAQLTDSLDDMVRGVGRVVAVVGEVGAGTSALVRMLVPEVRLRGGSIVTATCREHRLPVPYALWSEVLRGLRRLPVKSTRLWRELPALDPTLDRATGEGVTGGSKTQLLEELADFLRLTAQQRPLLLLLENLQWADAPSWDALEYLIAQLESERILIVLAFQTGIDDDVLEKWTRLSTRPRHSKIHLSHLTRDDVKRWLEAATHTKSLAREILAYVYRQSEGNPLVLTHLMRDLEEGGFVAPQGETWQWSSVNDLPAPVPLDQLLERRMARLPGSARAVLEAAAVLGREADASLLFDSSLDAPEARRGLDCLIERGLIIPTYDRGGAAYIVSHDEVARVARQRISAERHVELHERIARALAAHERQSVAEIAEHFESAGNGAEAHRYALLAADQALEVHETQVAAELLAAAERTAPTDGGLAEVRVRMASLAELAGRYEDAEALCDLALAWFGAQGGSVQALRLKRMRALVRMKRGEGARETLAVLLALEEEANASHARMERAAVLLLIAQMQYRLGDLRAAQRVAEEAVEIAESGDDAVLLGDACNRLAVTVQMEDVPRARKLYERSLEIATAQRDAYRRVRGLNNIGVLDIPGDPEEAWRLLTIAVEEARTAGLIESWGRAELNLGVLAGRMGDYERAQRAFSEALRLTSMVQNSEEQLYATYNLAHLERDNERIREAADTYELVVELAERIGQVATQAGALGGLGLCRFASGDHAAAREALCRGEVLSERLGDWFQSRELIEGLRIHLTLAGGDVSAAVSQLERSLELCHAWDVAGAVWLIAEFGTTLRPHAELLVDAAVERYRNDREVLDNPNMKKRYELLTQGR